MLGPTTATLRNCRRWGSISAASDTDSAVRASTGTSIGGPRASTGRHRCVLRAGLPVRLLDGPHSGAETAPRPQRRPAGACVARGPSWLGPGHRGGRPHAVEGGKPDDGPRGPGRLLRLGAIHRTHGFVRNLFLRILDLG